MKNNSMESIAVSEEFTLLDRPWAARNGWRNLKLISTNRRRKKRNWWFGWNGQRLAESRDVVLLKEHLPDVYDWVIAELQAHKWK
jgi:hypothetical protein